jgi:hypothetical protein
LLLKCSEPHAPLPAWVTSQGALQRSSEAHILAQTRGLQSQFGSSPGKPQVFELGFC